MSVLFLIDFKNKSKRHSVNNFYDVINIQTGKKSTMHGVHLVNTILQNQPSKIINANIIRTGAEVDFVPAKNFVVDVNKYVAIKLSPRTYLYFDRQTMNCYKIVGNDKVVGCDRIYDLGRNGEFTEKSLRECEIKYNRNYLISKLSCCGLNLATINTPQWESLGIDKKELFRGI